MKKYLFQISSGWIVSLLAFSPGALALSRIPVTDVQVDVGRFNRTAGCCSATGAKIAIAAGATHSAAAGLEIAKAGGNLIDVAVATSFAVAVERPQSNGIGGGGFATVHLPDGTNTFFDFRETAPAASTVNMFLDASGKKRPGNLSQEGVFSVATPGFIAGQWAIHKKGGKLPWKKVLEPAIRLAREGFAIYPQLAAKIESNKKVFWEQEATRALLFEGKKAKGIGDKLVQTDLAATLTLIAEKGPDAFYKGEIAQKILSTIKKQGGILTSGDLTRYEVRTRAPLTAKWKDFEFLTAPPPSAGGVILIEAMKVWGGLPENLQPKTEADYAHVLAEVFKHAYAERSQAIGDPAFVKVAVEALTSDAFAKKIRGQIQKDKAVPSVQIKPGLPAPETHGTTSVTIIDDQGGAFSATLTINTGFGSKVLVPGTGIFLNNEMDDFSIKPGETNAYGLTGDKANSIAPGKRPVSSMVPTLVLKGGKPVLAVSAGGGSRIITSVIQTTLNYLDVFPGDLQRAVFAPRMHHQWLPDKLDLEPEFTEASRDDLKKRGHTVSPPDWNPTVVAVGALGGSFTAVFDPRDEGGAAAR